MTPPATLRMKFLVYSQTNARTITDNSGRPEYSYYYIVKHFLPILERLGDVEMVYDPEREVDSIYQKCASRGQPCVFMHFSAPHNVFPGIKCPTLRVFAWEYSTIPSDPWKNEGYQDWRAALSRSAGAVTISGYTVKTTKQTMGPDYPVVSVPCPVWDNFEPFRRRHDQVRPEKSVAVHFDGVVVDSRMVDLQIRLPTDEEIAQRNRKADAKMAIMAEKNERLIRGEAELLRREADLYDRVKREWLHLNATRQEIEEAEEETLVNINLRRKERWRELRGTLKGRIFLLRAAMLRFVSDVVFAFGVGDSRPAVKRRLRAIVGPSWVSPTYRSGAIEAEEKKKDMCRAAEQEEALAAETLRQEKQARDKEDQEKHTGQQVRSDAVVQNGIYLEGIVYTAILNVDDVRKNWHDMVIAFGWAFRDVEDATLVIKSTAPHVVEFADELIFYLRRLAPIKCRVVFIHAYLDDKAYDALLEATTYYVNTSYGEGQSIPLCEAMSAGIPAVAPNHTAMSEYVFPDSAFIFSSNEELTSWQHDPRRSYRCVHYRPDWRSLVDAYRRSYDVAKNNPDAYFEMGRNAMEHLKNHCSLEVTTRTLQTFLEQNRQLFERPDCSAFRHQSFRETV